MKIDLNLYQAEQLLQLYGGHPTSITLTMKNDDVIVFYTEYPEEGSFILDEEFKE